MKNFVQLGTTIPVTAPAGGVKSGDGVLIGSLFGVANHDAPEGGDVESTVSGVFDLAKAAVAISQGAKVYWNATAKAVTTSASGNSLIGAAVLAAAADAATARVRLNGVTI